MSRRRSTWAHTVLSFQRVPLLFGAVGLFAVGMIVGMVAGVTL